MKRFESRDLAKNLASFQNNTKVLTLVYVNKYKRLLDFKHPTVGLNKLITYSVCYIATDNVVLDWEYSYLLEEWLEMFKAANRQSHAGTWYYTFDELDDAVIKNRNIDIKCVDVVSF